MLLLLFIDYFYPLEPLSIDITFLPKLADLRKHLRLEAGIKPFDPRHFLVPAQATRDQGGVISITGNELFWLQDQF